MNWQLPSNSGRHLATWTVTDQTAEHFSCDFEFRSQSADSGQPTTVIKFSRLILSKSTLSKFAEAASDWLDQSLPNVASSAFVAAVEMGGGFDTVLKARFGDNPTLISAQNSAVSFDYTVAGVGGEFSYVVDQSCLRLLVEGISAALESRNK